MRAIFCLCLLFVYPFWVISVNRVDSIKTELINHTSIDAQYIRLMSKLSFELWPEDANEGRKYAEKAMKVADSLKDSTGRAFAILGIGLNSWGQDNFNEAMEYFLQAENEVKNHGDSNDIMLFKYHIALAYQGERIIDLSNRNFNILIPYYKRTGDKYMLAMIYEARALNYIYEKSQEKEIRTRSFNRALLYLDSAQVLFKEIKEGYQLTRIDLFRGIAELSLNKMIEADMHFKKALKGFHAFDDVKGVVMAEKEIGQAFSDVNHPDSAQAHLLRALRLAEKYEMEVELFELYYSLYELEFKKKNFEKALEYYKEHITSFDKKVNRQISYQVHEMKMKYDKEKNEQEIKLLSQEKKIQNTYIVALSLLIIVISISAVIIGLSFRNSRKKDAELNQSKEALMQAELSNARLKEKELKVELEKKNLELTNYTMNFIQKGTLLSELQEKLSTIDEIGDEKISSNLRECKAIIKRHISSEKDWEDFKTYFENVHPSFIQAMRQKQPDLSNAEIRLAALLKMNLNSKQIADVMGISPDSVKTARHRLRNKFGLDRDQNLTQFLNHLEAEDLVKNT